MHGDFLAEQVDEKLVGGVSLLFGYIERVRKEEPNTLYAIAGRFAGLYIEALKRRVEVPVSEVPAREPITRIPVSDR